MCLIITTTFKVGFIYFMINQRHAWLSILFERFLIVLIWWLRENFRHVLFLRRAFRTCVTKYGGTCINHNWQLDIDKQIDTVCPQKNQMIEIWVGGRKYTYLVSGILHLYAIHNICMHVCLCFSRGGLPYIVTAFFLSISLIGYCNYDFNIFSQQQACCQMSSRELEGHVTSPQYVTPYLEGKPNLYCQFFYVL